MTRSRRTQFEIINTMRRPVVALFSIVPKYLARFLLRTFRWSDGFIGYGIRYLCVKRLAKSCGNKVLISPGCILHWLENCELGENITINAFCYIDAIGGVRIGDNTRIAHSCSVITGQHRYDLPGRTIIDSGYTTARISIGSDVWLGTGVVILQGVKIGDGAVVGASSVVTNDVKPYTVVAGIPVKLIKRRFDSVSENNIPHPQQ